MEERMLSERLIGVQGLAKYLDVPVSWVYGKTRQNGEDCIPFHAVGKYRRFAVDSKGVPYEVMDWLRRQQDRG